MIRVTFRTRQEQLTGFTVTGHADTAPAGEDIVCAAVSSAAYMTANTITEVVGAAADITVKEGYMRLSLTGDVTASQPILSGFRLHIQALQEQYPQGVQLMNTEV